MNSLVLSGSGGEAAMVLMESRSSEALAHLETKEMAAPGVKG